MLRKSVSYNLKTLKINIGVSVKIKDSLSQVMQR
jgi:hypothetical protein